MINPSTARDSRPHTSRFFARPATKTGNWAARMLVVTFAIFMVSSALAGAFGRRDPGTVDDIMRFTGPIIGVGFVVSGLAALVLSVRSLIVEHERSIVVWLGLVFGLFVAMFLAGEFLIPH